MTNKTIIFGSKAWHEYIKRKYVGKSIPAGVIHNERVKLEEKYGEKIILGKFEDMMTDKEKMDFVEYKALGDALNRVSPDYNKADGLLKGIYYIRMTFNRMLSRDGKKIFLAILGILIALALIKYLFV